MVDRPKSGAPTVEMARLRQTILARHKAVEEKLGGMGLLTVYTAAKEVFGEGVRLEAAISEQTPYFIGDRDYCRRWWRKTFLEGRR